MKHRLVDIVRCPACNESLTSNVISKHGCKSDFIPKEVICKQCSYTKNPSINDCEDCFKWEIDEGILECKCGKWYPVISGIPRILPSELLLEVLEKNVDFVERNRDYIPINSDKTDIVDYTLDMKRKTASSFGFQWNAFSDMFHEFEQNFLNYIYPIKPEFFKNKRVLDVGCGFGRHTYYAAKYGAEVIGIDLSEAVEAAHENLKEFPNAHIVQGDLYNLPLTNDFDFIFSIGVLHHLPDPEGGFKAIVDFAKSRTEIFIWVYGISKGGTAINEFFRTVTPKIPFKILYSLTFAHAVVIQYTFNKIYLSLKKLNMHGVANCIPYKIYAKFPFRVAHADSFDTFSVPITKYYTQEEIDEWLNSAGLIDTWTSELVGCWRGYGVKK